MPNVTPEFVEMYRENSEEALLHARLAEQKINHYSAMAAAASKAGRNLTTITETVGHTS